MSFTIQKATQKKFDTLDDAVAFATTEQEKIYRLPLKGFLSKGAHFHGDQYLGDPSTKLQFNEHSFDAICRLAGTNRFFIERISEEELASKVLNDIFQSGETTKKLDTLELVCDEASNQVVGVVSGKFVGYSNKQFIDDVLDCIGPSPQKSLFPDTGAFEFKEAYSVNTRLFMRLTSTHVAGCVAGWGGEGEDRSEIGVEFSNSMAGGHALRLAYFIHRLVCANGLVAKVGGDDGRLIHSGDEKKFRERLHEKATGVIGNLKNARKMIETLGSLEFDAAKLAKHYDINDVLDIFPDPEVRDNFKKAFRNREYPNAADAKDKKLQRSTDQFKELPLMLGNDEAKKVFKSGYRDNASMYDFINVFTAYAKECEIAKRVQMEEKAGELAGWIASNKRKFK
jgi:hypothetical protein